ncbi:MATE family efflux transporter, partial [Ruminococcaceae bacterium OttesenSCG-928-L11]|nr:MATE family efflux transporter [Ruminococcaceae bacterium OttesenSCG-928-L11]
MIIKDKKFYLYFFSLAIPMMLQNVVVLGVNLMDNLMLGGYSELSISAAAVANQIQFALQMLTMGICEGVVVLSSQYWGQKRLGEMKSIIGIGMKLQVVLGILTFLLVAFFPYQLASLLTDDAATIEECVKYLQIMKYTYPLFCMMNMLVSSMRIVESIKIGFAINITALVVNVIFNYILIFGHFGAPRLGIVGAAIATLLSRIVEFAIAAVYVLKVDKKLQLKIREFFRMDFSYLKDYLRVGMPVLLANFVWAVANGAQVAILGRLGAQTLAANSIASTLFNLVYVASGAVGSVSGIIIGKTVGEGDFDRVKNYARSLQLVYLGVGVFSSACLYLVKLAILQFYNIAPDTYALTNTFLNILCITIIGSCYQVPCLTGIVRGGGDTKFVLINDTIHQWLIVLPAAFIAAFVLELPPAIVFVCLKSDQIL